MNQKEANRWVYIACATLAGVLLAFLIVHQVRAAGTTANVSWTHPVTKIDGTPITVNDIKETIIKWRRTITGPVVGTATVTAPAITTQVPNLVCGDFVFVGVTILKEVGSTPSADSPPSNLYATGVNCNQANPPGAPTAQ